VKAGALARAAGLVFAIGLDGATPALARTAGLGAEVQSEPSGPSGSSAAVRSLGPVTYGEADVDVPLGPHAVIIPEVELLYLGPVEGDSHREFHPFVGAALMFEEPQHFDWGFTLTEGPPAYGVAIVGGSLELSKDFEGDGTEPVLLTDLDLSLHFLQFDWIPPSTQGASAWQLYADAKLRLALTDSLVLRPRVMFFLYDHVFVTVDDVTALSLLARVGTFPPRLYGGGRLTWKATTLFYPFVEAAQLLYVADVGSGTQVDVGVRAKLGTHVILTVAGGVLHNRLAGMASTLDDQRTLPLLDATCEVDF
jgi:hypothetical protein